MKILVLMKQVAARDVALRIEAGATRLDESEFSYETNEPDAYALEAALGLKETQAGEVVVLGAGPERVADCLRDALAKGADRAIHVEVEEPGDWDGLSMGAAAGRGRGDGEARPGGGGVAVGRPRLRPDGGDAGRNR